MSSEEPIEPTDKPDEAPESPQDDTTEFDDEKTGLAIDDIVAKEGDDILAAQDAATSKAAAEPVHGFWYRWWHNKWARGITLLIIAGGIAAAAAVPTSRYWLLNTAGVRVSASVVVTDGTTELPLKGVPVTIGGQRVQTNGDGQAKIHNLRQGPQKLHIEQSGFATIDRLVTLGWGSNPLGNVDLKAVGVQYVIEVRDYLSDKPVQGVEASAGDATAVSDKDGKVTLTLASTQAAKDGVTLAKGGYRTQQIMLTADPKTPTKAALVLDRKAVFVLKQNGKYDVYKSDIDGKNRQVLLAGTGRETSNISLMVSPDGTHAALVSTREDKRDADGALLNTLTLIQVDDGETLTLGQAPQIQLIDWIGPRLIFQQISADTSAANHYTVAGYNYSDNTRVQLAAANQLNAVLSAQGAMYYVVAPDPDNAAVQAGFFKVDPKGNGKQLALQGEVWTVLRTAYNTFSLQTADGTWHTYNIPDSSVAQVGTPGSLMSRGYTDNTDRSKSLWINQGALTSYDIASTKDTVVTTQTGVGYPVEWLSANAAIYRLSAGGETADYAVSTEGGMPHKVADVFGTYGIAQAQ